MGHNLSIDALLEDLNLGYMLDNHEADIIRDKIQNIDTTIAVWVGEYIPEQASLEVIEQILLDSSKFQRFDVDQVQLLTIRII